MAISVPAVQGKGPFEQMLPTSCTPIWEPKAELRRNKTQYKKVFLGVLKIIQKTPRHTITKDCHWKPLCAARYKSINLVWPSSGGGQW